jgi:hypothetical protein
MVQDPSSVTRRTDQFHSLTLFQAGFSFAKRHYLLTAFYIVGLLLVQFGTGLAVSQVQRQNFDKALAKIDMAALEEARAQAFHGAHDVSNLSTSRMTDAHPVDQQYRQSRGWFFTCDKQCHEMYELSQLAKQALQRQEDAYNAAISEARASVGIFSEYGVSDARESFWNSYYGGTSFAKRMSYYDALFMSIGAMRRDESLLSVFLNWLLSAALNFTMGMITALVTFMFHVGSLLFSYQASPLTAVGFFALAFCGAFAVIASFLVGAYFAAATTALVALTATGNMRIEFQPDGRQGRMRIRHHRD